jgi:Flp pilus assembly protein TadD
MTEPAPDHSTASIVAALQSNQALKAEMAARQRVALNSQDTEALVLLAIALSLQNRPVEVVELYRKLIDLEPTEASHHNNLATALRDTGDLVGAENAYRAALAIEPTDASIISNLGSLRWQQGDAVETRDLMLAACKIDPGLPEARIYGALACHECADNDLAKEFLRGSNSWQYVGPLMESDLATALMQVERVGDAEVRLRALLERPEAEAIARLRLAGQLERVNRLDEAEALLADATIDPAYRDEELSLRAALASRRGRADEAVSYYREALGSADNDIGKAPQWFALGKACDSTTDAAGAMDALRKAHALQMKTASRLVPHLLEPDSNPLEITRYKVEAGSLERWQLDPAAPSAEASPIFVVGFPRSGTTLLEQMLDSHPGVRSMDERAFLQNAIGKMQESGELVYPDDLDRLSADQVEVLRNTYWSCVREVVDLADGERLVDKNPLNILRLPILHRLFPKARIILALRHPCDVILSNYMQSFRAPAFQVLCSSLDRLARGYMNAMDFWNLHSELFNPAVLELRYEDLVADVATQTNRIADHLGLDDARALEQFQERARAKGYIATPSYAQVVEPLNKKAVGRWQRYREYLDPILPVLEPAMKRWHYEA